MSVWHKEYDLIFPLEENYLGAILEKLFSAMRSGKKTWYDPVIIIRGAQILPEEFQEKYSLCLAKDKEEFYTFLHNIKQKEFLVAELDKICSSERIGTLRREDITFPLSYVNTKFANYLAQLQF